MKITLRYLLILTIGLHAYAAKSQVNYKFSYKTEPYNSITGGTQFLANQFMDTIAIGFDIHLGGQQNDSLYINRQGNMSLNNGIPFNFFSGDLQDGVETYIVTGTPGDRILKIQFSNLKFGHDFTASDYINFQVWVYEKNSVIEISFGASSVNNPDHSYYFNGGPGIGTGKTWLKGSAQNPVTDTTAGTYLTGTPPNGMVYRFEPEGVSVSDIESKRTIQLFPNPGNGLIHFKTTTQGKQTISVYNLLQHRVAETVMSNQDRTLDITSYPAGMYIISVADKNGRIQNFAYLKQR